MINSSDMEKVRGYRFYSGSHGLFLCDNSQSNLLQMIVIGDCRMLQVLWLNAAYRAVNITVFSREPD